MSQQSRSGAEGLRILGEPLVFSLHWKPPDASSVSEVSEGMQS